jgi:hypothetical protein
MFTFFGLGSADGPRFEGPSHGATLMLLYSGGVVLIFTTFLMLFRHAWTRRAALNLSAADEVSLRFGVRSHAISLAVGLLSMALVFVFPAAPAFAGMVYFLMGPLHGWNGYLAGRAQTRLAAEQPPTPTPGRA